MLPAACFVYGGATPHPGRAIEIEEEARTRAAGVFENEVAIEQDRFDFGEKGIIAIDVRPPRLHHADIGIGKVVNGAHQKIFGRL